jgi:hypothetical protein
MQFPNDGSYESIEKAPNIESPLKIHTSGHCFFIAGGR